jgi:hypothetical protein
MAPDRFGLSLGPDGASLRSSNRIAALNPLRVFMALDRFGLSFGLDGASLRSSISSARSLRSSGARLVERGR